MSTTLYINEVVDDRHKFGARSAEADHYFERNYTRKLENVTVSCCIL